MGLKVLGATIVAISEMNSSVDKSFTVLLKKHFATACIPTIGFSFTVPKNIELAKIVI